MNDFEKLIQNLSVEKRRLLEQKLKAEGRVANAFTLSFAQQRLWFLYQLDPSSTAYHIPAALRLIGKLNIKALKEALTTITKRHEILRTTFSTINGTPIQIVSNNSNVSLSFVDISTLAPQVRQQELEQILLNENAKPFDLNKGPLWKVKVIKLSENEHVLYLLMHHIISDGWSVGVFVNEFSQLYNSYIQGSANPLPPLKIQYADFAVWQKRNWKVKLKKSNYSIGKKSFLVTYQYLNCLLIIRDRPLKVTVAATDNPA